MSFRTHSCYMCIASLNSDSDSEGQTTKESHTLYSKVDALSLDNPLQLQNTQAVGEQDFTPVESSQTSVKDERILLTL